MKIINLGHGSLEATLLEMKKHSEKCEYGSKDGIYSIKCVCEEIDTIDTDGNDHITQDEIVEHVQKIAPNKSREEIISDVDTDDNGRITKKEVRDWIKKDEK